MRTFVLAALLLAIPAVTRATVVIPIEFRELVSVSTTILHGRVTRVRTDWVDGRRAIQTFVTVAADEFLKGPLDGTVTVAVPGGQIGRYKTVFVGAPEFREGDEIVLFLRAYRGRQFIVGLNQGAFRVAPDSGGRRVVTGPVVMGKSGSDPQPVVRGDATRRPLAIAAFRDLVKGIVADGAAR
jgi:hypothetical protein